MSLGPDPEVIRERRSEWSRIAAMAFMCGLFAFPSRPATITVT